MIITLAHARALARIMRSHYYLGPRGNAIRSRPVPGEIVSIPRRTVDALAAAGLIRFDNDNPTGRTLLAITYTGRDALATATEKQRARRQR